MPRRLNRYDHLRRRLDEWGDYRRNIASAVGWNVHLLDFDADTMRGVQKRNDTHADPVAQEYARMIAEQKRNMTTDTAVTELRPRWMRRLIVGRHKRWPDLSDRQLAAKLGMNHRFIGNNLWIAYDILIDRLDGLDGQRFGRHLRQQAGVAFCPTV